MELCWQLYDYVKNLLMNDEDRKGVHKVFKDGSDWMGECD